MAEDLRISTRFKAVIYAGRDVMNMRYMYWIIHTIRSKSKNAAQTQRTTSVSNWIGRPEAMQDDETDSCHLE